MSVGGSETLTQMSSERHSSESGGCCGELCWGKVTLDWGKNSKEPETKWRQPRGTAEGIKPLHLPDGPRNGLYTFVELIWRRLLAVVEPITSSTFAESRVRKLVAVPQATRGVVPSTACWMNCSPPGMPPISPVTCVKDRD